VERRQVIKATPYDAGAAAHAMQDLDPITLEVVRMGLYEISMEMATTVMRVSGSPLFTETGDFSTGLLDSAGEHLAFGGYLQLHMSNSLLATQHLLSITSLDEMQPGDAWLFNDPFLGSSQVNDFGVLSPIFDAAGVIGFAWAEGHVLDVGGAVTGGFGIGIRECYAEGLRFPNLKFAGPDGIDRNVLAFIKNNVRLSVAVENDLRALWAATRVGRVRVQELAERYGREEFKQYCEGFKAASERLFRQRVASIPDGRWRVRDWAEHDGHANDLYELEGSLEVRGDTLSLHFTGAPQTEGIVNGTAGCVLGNALTAIMQVLAPEIPYNSGILRAIDLSVDDGSVLSALPPAPVSSAHMEATMRAGKMTTELISRAVLTSEDAELRRLAMGQFHDAFAVIIWWGADQFGPTIFADSDGGMGGGGAQSVTDGLDVSQTMTQPNSSLVDVEGQEQLYPILYLYRRLSVDSGGPGVYRGGLGGDAAIIPWCTTSNGFVGTLATACNQVPPRGIAGGFPAGASWFEIVDDADIPSEFFAQHRLPSFEELSERGRVLEAKAGNVSWSEGQVFRHGLGGGGGFGDPLLRSPAAVLADVTDGYVTRRAAQDAYGVCLDPRGNVDPEATASRRRELRAARLGREPTREVATEHIPGVPFDRLHNLQRDGTSSCCACGATWGRDRGPNQGITSRTWDGRDWFAATGARVEPRAGIRVEAWLCVACGSALDVTVVADDANRLGHREQLMQAALA
jgi:N-methylhydantoinase B